MITWKTKVCHNYKEDLFTKVSAFYEEEAFLLASFDLSGIQDFIYNINIATNGAAKQLKARSLYLDFMSEYIADSLLDKLCLNRANHALCRWGTCLLCPSQY